nr:MULTISPECIES: alpha/beta hydrolase [unclassified Streptomyces]
MRRAIGRRSSASSAWPTSRLRGWSSSAPSSRAAALTGIPGVLVHGRRDIGSPLHTAWELARRWPDARLTVVEAAGHQGNAASRSLVMAALDRFAARP